MCSCAPGYFGLDIFSIFRVIALDLIKFCNFQLVSHVTQKGFDLESWNFTGMMICMCSCAPGCFHRDLLSIFRVIALDLENYCNFQYVSHLTQKGFDFESLNLLGRLLSICSFAPWVSLVDLSSICRVISLDLVKLFHYVVLFVPWVLELESNNFTRIMINIT
jgi:hypothetical protein